MIHDDVLSLVGNTPVVRLNSLAPDGIHMYVKIESRNPGGSVKDRIAVGMIQDLEQRAMIKKGDTIIESTAGNTGIALAMVAASKGYNFIAVLSETASAERIKSLRFFGARVLLTSKKMAASTRNKMVETLAARNGWFVCGQHINPANPATHARTTALEILRDFEDRRLDYWVSGWGTGGTLTGVGMTLRRERPDVKVVASEPVEAQLLGKGEWQPHMIPGWAPDFVPVILDRRAFDVVVPVSVQEGYRAAQMLARREGIMSGTSGGATLAAALKVADIAPKGSTILVMLPDSSERYMSTALFEGISLGSDDDVEGYFEWLKDFPEYRL
ncbi:cysteine synthase A [Chytriomyces sp. MP71]|nr:cysteine synthase A [Chytriomyces sp. MP71]